jgi:hypothetical protein
MGTQTATVVLFARTRATAVALLAIAVWILVIVVTAGTAFAQMPDSAPPGYPSAAAPAGDAPALGPPRTGQSPPPPPTPDAGQAYAGQGYPGQAYAGEGSAAVTAPAARAPAEAPPGTYLNSYPEPGPSATPCPLPAAPAGSCSPGCVYAPAEPGAWVGPCWIFRLEETVLQRSTTRSQPLFVDADARPMLNSQTDLNFPMQVGFDLGVLCHFPSGWEIEFGYFQVDSWLAKNFVPGDNFIYAGGSTTLPTTDTDVRYSSAIYLSEINLRRQWNEWLNLLIGFRGGEFDEHYLACSDSVLLSSRTTNALFGFQIGADVRMIDRGPFKINALCKAGVYGNSINQRCSVDSPSLGANLSENASHLAFLGELGLVATYEFGPHLSARVFYQAVWLSGVALAPEQLAGTNFDAGTLAIDPNGSVFYHGGGVGFEWKF